MDDTESVLVLLCRRRLVAITNGNAQTDNIPCLKDLFEFCVLAEQVGLTCFGPVSPLAHGRSCCVMFGV